MDWCGLGTDAYHALSNYTLTIDFGANGDKPVFLTDKAEATIGYTKSNRVGGETAGCLAYAISNLETFLCDEAVRREYRAYRYRSLNTGLQHGIAFFGKLPRNRIVAKALISPRQHRLNTA